MKSKPKCPIHLRPMIPIKAVAHGWQHKPVRSKTEHYRCRIAGCICVASIAPEPVRPKYPCDKFPKFRKFIPWPKDFGL